MYPQAHRTTNGGDRGQSAQRKCSQADGAEGGGSALQTRFPSARVSTRPTLPIKMPEEHCMGRRTGGWTGVRVGRRQGFQDNG